MVRFARWWRRGSREGAKRFFLRKKCNGKLMNISAVSQQKCWTISHAHTFSGKLRTDDVFLLFSLCQFPLCWYKWSGCISATYHLLWPKSEEKALILKPGLLDPTRGRKIQDTPSIWFLTLNPQNCICIVFFRVIPTNWHVIMTLCLAYSLRRILTLFVTCILTFRVTRMLTCFLTIYLRYILTYWTCTLKHFTWHIWWGYLTYFLAFYWHIFEHVVWYVIWYDMLYQYLWTV